MAEINKTPQEWIYELEDICIKVKEIPQVAFDSAEAVAQGQISYVHPLKISTQANQHKLGNHNLKVLEALKNLQKVILDGKPDVESAEN